MNHAQFNVAWSQQLLAGLQAGGVRHLVIAPGSRSTPLVLAAIARSGFECHVQPDERSAAWFALGIGKATGRPAALVTTSGTAVANCLPAVVEASQTQVPMILLTADRPAEAHACSANQTIDQFGIFGGFVRRAFALEVHEGLGLAVATSIGLQATDLAGWPLPGPVQINLGFREPLVAETPSEAAPAMDSGFSHPRCLPDPATLERISSEISGRAGLLVAGATPLDREARQALLDLAETLRAPILADPVSGLRFGISEKAPVCARHDLFLRNSTLRERLAPEWVLLFGAPPVSKVLVNWLDELAEHGVSVIRVRQAGDWPDPGRRGGWMIRAEAAPLAVGLLANEPEPGPVAHFSYFLEKDRELTLRLAEPDSTLPLEADILRCLPDRLPEHSQLFLGNSLVIRDADSFMGPTPRRLKVHANRGASGIDGNVSTVCGLAAAHPDRVTLGLLGDLAFWHDANGLLMAREHRVILVVFDNGGGGIFDYLPQSKLRREAFERYWRTPTHIEPARIAALHGLPHHRVDTIEGFETALASALADEKSHVIVMTIDQEQSVARHRAFWAVTD